jgi:hypothetical protein
MAPHRWDALPGTPDFWALISCRSRANEKGVPFDIEASDIRERCPTRPLQLDGTCYGGL